MFEGTSPFQYHSCRDSPMVLVNPHAASDAKQQLSYGAPTDQTTCFYVRHKDDTKNYYRAVYLKERDMMSLIIAIRKKFPESLMNVVLVTYNNVDNRQVLVDDDVIRHLPVGQDLIVEFVTPLAKVIPVARQHEHFDQCLSADQDFVMHRNEFDEYLDEYLDEKSPVAQWSPTEFGCHSGSPVEPHPTKVFTPFSGAKSELTGSPYLSDSMFDSFSGGDGESVWSLQGGGTTTQTSSRSPPDGGDWGFDPSPVASSAPHGAKVQAHGSESRASDKVGAVDGDGSKAPDSKKSAPLTSDEKRRQAKDRNRDAATKCRVKKRQWQKEQEEDLRYKKQENSRLRNTIAELQMETRSLVALMADHADCASQHNT